MDWLAYALIGVGLLLLLIGGFVAREAMQFRLIAMKGQGTVIAILRVPGNDTYRPKVSYKAKNGQQVEFVSELGSDPPSFKVHDTVKVLYNPRNPAEAKIDNFWQQWFGTVLLIVAGLASFLTGSVWAITAFLEPR